MLYRAYAAPCVGDTRGRPECRPGAPRSAPAIPSTRPVPNGRGGKVDTGRDPGCNPASGCCNCKDWWAVGCHLGKLSCEFTTSVMGTSNAFQEGLNKTWIPIVAIIGVGALVFFLVLKK